MQWKFDRNSSSWIRLITYQQRNAHHSFELNIIVSNHEILDIYVGMCNIWLSNIDHWKLIVMILAYDWYADEGNFTQLVHDEYLTISLAE